MNNHSKTKWDKVIEIEIDQDIALWVKNFKNRNLAINEILRSYYTTITELKRF
jgi:hypothetical protein